MHTWKEPLQVASAPCTLGLLHRRRTLTESSLGYCQGRPLFTGGVSTRITALHRGEACSLLGPLTSPGAPGTLSLNFKVRETLLLTKLF